MNKEEIEEEINEIENALANAGDEAGWFTISEAEKRLKYLQKLLTNLTNTKDLNI